VLLEGSGNVSQLTSSEARRAPRHVILIAAIALGFVGFAGLILMLVIGGPSVLERIDATSGGIPAVDGFPADFPVYAGASLQSSGWDSTSSGGYAIWLSTGSKKQLVAYYNAALAQGDWQDKEADFHVARPQILFRRASQPTYGGTLSLQTNKLNGVTRISVEMSPDYWKAAPSPSSTPAS